MDSVFREAVKLISPATWRREAKIQRKSNCARNLTVCHEGLMSVRKRLLIVWMAWVFLISFVLLSHTLQVFGHPFGGAVLSAVSSERPDPPTGRTQAETMSQQSDRLMPGADEFHMQAVKAGSSETSPRTETDSMVSVERKVRDAQLTIQATALSENIIVEGDEFCVPPGEAVAWEVELSVYNMRASTGWRYWDACLEFGPELSVEAVDGPGAIDPVPQGGSPSEPTLTIRRDENTRKTKVVWSWHSLEDNISSDFPKRAKVAIRLRVRSSQESGYRPGSYVFCDNAAITYMTGAKRPKETTYELAPIVVNVTSL